MEDKSNIIRNAKISFLFLSNIFLLYEVFAIIEVVLCQKIEVEMKSSNIFLIGIVLVAVFLRFFQLGVNPPSLTWDEVAWGYNAYSLGKDFKDEFGRFLPIDYLESFGDFKPPLYAYLATLPVKIFGLNEFAVRFPSALFGVLTVLITYFLVKRIFGSQEKLALISSFLLAISPWHINLSRAAFEANVTTFFLVTGVWLFLAGVQEKRWYLVFSAISFVFSMYTFNTARVVAPLLVLLFAIGFQKELLQRKKQVLFAIIIGVFLVLPLARFMLTPYASLRFKEVNIFSDIAVIEQTNQEITNDNNAFWSRVIHNRRVAYGIEYVRHYLDNFNPRFLFINGDGNPKFSTQDVGQLYIWELPFLIAGILLLFRKKEGYWWVILLWLLLGVIPAATARETPHALRIETILPTFQILIAYGIVRFLNAIEGFKYKNLLIACLLLFVAFNFIYYLHGYYAHYPRIYSGEWQYGYKEALNYVRSEESKYEAVYITEALGRPYIYTLFYLTYDPKQFRKEAIIQREALGFVHVKGFGKYRFARNLKTLAIRKRVIYLDLPGNVPNKVRVLKRFPLLNGNIAFIAYTR